MLFLKTINLIFIKYSGSILFIENAKVSMKAL